MRAHKSILLAAIDEESMAERAEVLARAGYQTLMADTLHGVRRALDLRDFDLVLVGPKVPRRDTRQILGWAREIAQDGREIKTALIYADSPPSEFPADAYLSAKEGETVLLATISLLLFREVRLETRSAPAKPPKLSLPKPPARTPALNKPPPLRLPKPPRPPNHPKPRSLRVPKRPTRG